jgi:HD-GYP domain-containing protein (c-di-GMP phosphodiesterase class II)
MGGVVPCVLHHHERIDGDGYPQGLRGEAIPLSARLIEIADSFDAMTTDRSYRRAMPVEDAGSELLRVAGTQLDEHLVRTFVDLVMRGQIVLLDVQAHPTDSPRS